MMEVISEVEGILMAEVVIEQMQFMEKLRFIKRMGVIIMKLKLKYINLLDSNHYFLKMLQFLVKVKIIIFILN
jgi:hypothetical protein